MNRPEPTFDASVRRLAELDFEMAMFGHSRPIRTGAAAAFRRFAASWPDDGFAAAGVDAARARTLRSEHPFAPSEATKQLDQRIDYVLARTTGCNTVEVRRTATLGGPVDGLHPSDHDAVIVDLELTD